MLIYVLTVKFFTSRPFYIMYKYRCMYKYFLDVAETSKAAADLGMEVDVQYAKRFFCNIAFRYLDRYTVRRNNLTPLAEAWDNVHGAGAAQ